MKLKIFCIFHLTVFVAPFSIIFFGSMTSIISNMINQIFQELFWFFKKSYRLVEHHVVNVLPISPALLINKAASSLT